MRRLSVPFAAVLAAALVLPAGASAQTQVPTSSAQIQVWNASLKLVNSTTEQINAADAAWRAVFKQMGASAQYQYRPDLITVLEVPFKDQGEVKRQIETSLGAEYGSVHSDYGVTFCENNRSNDCGNTMLVWLQSRFDKVLDSSGNAEVERWPQFSDKNGDEDCDDAGDLNKHDGNVVADQIAARLRDGAQGKTLVLSGVHFASGAPVPCLAKNLKKVSDLFENKWPNRPLTVVTGDLNEAVDIHHLTAENTHWRPETDTACWYEEFSALHSERSTCQLFSSWYYDAIWAENAGTNPSAAICPHWTIGNFHGNYDYADTCESGRKRIDYIWIRYEDSSGVRQELSLAQIREKIEQAGTDRGYYESPTEPRQQYSDHRALHARIRW